MTKKWFRVIIVFSLCIIAFVITSIKMDFFCLVAKEENYKVLEEIAYEIIETKNVFKPISEELSSYEISVNDDGTIDVKLYSDSVEYISFTILEDYQIRSIEQHSLTPRIIFLTIYLLVIIVLIIMEIVKIKKSFNYNRNCKNKKSFN